MNRPRCLAALLMLTTMVTYTLLGASSARADDDPSNSRTPKTKTPKRKRVVIKPARKHVVIRSGAQSRAAAGHPAKTGASPMDVARQWLAHRAVSKMEGGIDLSEALRAWFDGGEKVPLADLRDAFKAHGWDAAKLQAWLQRQMAGALPGLLQAFAARGPRAGGLLAAPVPDRAMGWRRGRARPFPMPDGPQGACPLCGHASGERGMDSRYGAFGRRGRAFGRRGGMWGRRFGRRFAGRTFRERGFGPRAFDRGGGVFAGPVQTQQRAYVLWNDGHGWQRRALPSGRGFGPMGPHARGGDADRAPSDRPGSQAAPWMKMFNAWRRGAQPQAPGAQAQGRLGVGQLKKMLDAFAGTQPGEHPAKASADTDQLESILRLIEAMRKQGAHVSVDGISTVNPDPKRVLIKRGNRIKRLPIDVRQGAKKPAPKKVEAPK